MSPHFLYMIILSSSSIVPITVLHLDRFRWRLEKLVFRHTYLYILLKHEIECVQRPFSRILKILITYTYEYNVMTTEASLQCTKRYYKNIMIIIVCLPTPIWLAPVAYKILLLWRIIALSATVVVVAFYCENSTIPSMIPPTHHVSVLNSLSNPHMYLYIILRCNKFFISHLHEYRSRADAVLYNALLHLVGISIWFLLVLVL